ncbi:MAG: tetratricopeptide repeat protein [Bacteroidota bacterium]
MKKALLLALLAYASMAGLLAQLPTYNDYLYLYNEANELFEKEKFGAAQKKIEAFLVFEEDLRANEANDLHANAKYIQAVSAVQLEREDAEALLDEFLIDFSENTKAPLAAFYLGKHYYVRRKYSKAIGPLVKAVQSSALDQEVFDEVVFKLGYSYFKDENYPQAVQYFDMAANKKNKYQEDARYYKAILLYQQGKYAEAYSALNALKTSKKYGQDTRVYLANTLFQLKKMDELFVLADDLVRGPRLKKEDAQIYYIVANASFEKEDFPKSTEYYGQFEKNRGKLNRTDYFRYGYAEYQQKAYEASVPHFQKVIKQDATDSLSQIASYYLGFALLETNDEEAAKLAFFKAAQGGVQAVPTITQDALYQYAKVAFSTESYADALKALNQIIRDYPKAGYIGEVQTMIGEVYLYNRNYPEAVKYFESIPRSTTRAKRAYQTVCYFYGIELFEKGKLKEAYGYFQKAIATNQDKTTTLSATYWKAETQFRQKQYQPAQVTYQAYQKQSAASQNEFYARSFYGLGWSHYKQKEYKSAIKAFNTFIDRAAKNENRKLVVDAHTRVADGYFLQKSYPNAIDYYNRVMRFKYIFRDYAAYQIAEAYYRQNNYQQSVNTFDKLITNFKRSEFRDDALDRISDIYATWIRDYNQTLKYAQMLVKDYPKSPLAVVAYNRMALASYNLGNKDNAIKYYKKVLTDYGADKKNSQAALDNLRNLVSEREFDKILKDYRNSNPKMDNNLAEIVFSTAKERYFSGNYTSAIDQFSTYIKDYKNGPDYIEALLFRARSYNEIGKFDPALKDYKKIYDATVANSYTFQALDEAAEIEYKRRNYSESLALFNQLERNAGKLANQVIGLFGIAKSQQGLGQYTQAIAALRKITDNAEVTIASRTQARVQIGQAQYESGNLDAALTTFQSVENDFKNEFGAESQLMIGTIYLDQGIALKEAGQTEAANTRLKEVATATKYMANNYPTFNYLKAKMFYILAEAYYQRGKVFQAKGTLGSLISEDRYPDIQEQARKRLAEIEAEEAANDNG